MRLRLWLALSVLAAATVPAHSAAPQGTPSRPRITGIDHVAFRVSDREAARRFYGGMLGLRESRVSTGSAFLLFQIGGRQRVMLQTGLAAAEEERLDHLAFGTPDVHAMRQFLAARGALIEPARGCQQGAVRTRDPDGHAIEFVAAPWPPGRSEGAPELALSDRLLHAGLVIRDEEAAHSFYRDWLGFSEIWRGGRKEGVTQWVNMRVPDGTDYLEYMLVASPPDRRQRGVLHHMCLLVPDVQTAWEEVVRRTPAAARGAMSAPQVGVNGRWQLNLFDAEGTRTELMEPFRVR